MSDVEPLPEVVEGVVSSHDSLGIPDDSTAQEVIKAYKRLSVRWHPDKNRDNLVVAERRFKEINEAYLALVDPDTATLRKREDAAPTDGYAYLAEGMHKSVVTHPLLLSLEELYRGCTKRKELLRNRVSEGDLVPEKKTLVIRVERGWRNGTRLHYPDLGGPVGLGGRCVDVVYEIKQDPHPVFRRIGDDLLHRYCLLEKRSDLRLPRFSETPLGTAAAPLVPYCNVLSELCQAGVTLVKPRPLLSTLVADLNTRRTPEQLAEADAARPLKWAAPRGKGVKLRDRDSTASRIRMPGALQAALGVAGGGSGESDALHSVAWKISKKTDEVVVGLAPPTAHCDRRFYADVAPGKWGVVWKSDGNLHLLGSETPKLKLEPYGPNDVCQLTVHTGDNQVFAFKNGNLLLHEGKKIVIPTHDKVPGDVVDIEGEGMPVVRNGKVVGRGDIQVTFTAPRAPTATRAAAAAPADEAGSFEAMQEWLQCRSHPEPEVDVQNWQSDTGTGRQFQVKVVLKQKRPYSKDGAFDQQPFMGRMRPEKQAALDSVGCKVLRALTRLAERFPDAHVAKKSTKKRPAEEAAQEQPQQAKAQKVAPSSDVHAVVPPPASTLEDID